jgi:hypothetical protein
MSRRSSRTLFCMLASFAVISVVHAQEPSADDTARVQSGPQAQPQPQTPKPETPPPSDHSSTPSPAPAASNSQPAANKSPSVTTIVVNGGPSADILRSARNAGFTVKIAGGTTHFCKSEAPIGTRLVSERCLNEEQLTLFLERSQDQREKLSHLLGAPANAH